MNPTCIITSDIHARKTTPKNRKDDYWETLKGKIRWLRELQKGYKPYPVIDGGDLFNSWKGTPLVESWLIENLPIPFYTTIGNHEEPYHNSNYFEESSLNVLASAGAIRIVNSNCPCLPFNDNLLGIYGIPFGIQGSVAPSPELFYSVLIIHDMITLKEDKRFESKTAKEVLNMFPGFNLIVSGHNHESFYYEENGRFLVNPGSLMRINSDQVDHKPKVYLWYAEEKRIEAVEVPIKSKEEVFDLEYIELRKQNDDRVEKFVSGFKDYDMDISFEKNLENHFTKNRTRQGVKKEIMEALNE